MKQEYLEQMRAHVDEGGRLIHRNSVDLLAEVERLQAQLEAVERERDRAEELNRYFRDGVGECHLMISRDTVEYQVRKDWDATDLPARLQKVMLARDHAIEHCGRATVRAERAEDVAEAAQRALTDRGAEIERLRDAIGTLGAIGNGYCFCSHDRDPDKADHQPECRDARQALAPTAAPGAEPFGHSERTYEYLAKCESASEVQRLLRGRGLCLAAAAAPVAETVIDKDWCINMARQEGDSEIGAGVLARDLEPLAKIAPGVVERLTCMGHAMPTCREAADTIRALQAERDQLAQTLAAIEEDGTVEHNAAVKLRQEVAALRLALAPFAKIEIPHDAGDATWVAATLYCNDMVTAFSVRRARAALDAGKRQEGE